MTRMAPHVAMPIPWLIPVLLWAALLPGQTAPELLIENEQVRVQKYVLPIGGALRIPAAASDRVAILASGLLASLAKGTDPVFSPERRTVIFLQHGQTLQVQATNPGGIIVLVDFRKTWDSEVRPCDGPQCVRSIHAGGQTVGETRTFFSNGFVSAYRHSLVRGASLASSYYTQGGTDHILMIPFSKLRATFNTDEVQLSPDQVFYSTARDVEVSADEGAAVWFVLRVQVKSAPK